MANWFDVASLIVTLAFFAGAIAAVIFVSGQVKQTMASTQDGLKKRGLDISSHGMSVKTDKRFDREDYVDATQRGVVNLAKVATYGAPSRPISMQQRSSAAPEETKGRDRGHSTSSEKSVLKGLGKWRK